MRSQLVLSLALAAVSAAACNIPLGPEFCLPMDGPCQTQPQGGGQSITVTWIAGLPFERINTAAARVDLIPGDSVTLHLLNGPNGPQRSGDTVRVVTWAVASAGAARITSGQGGSATLVAIAPGTFAITANGSAPQLFACSLNDCWVVWSVRVVAAPSPSTR